MSAARARPAFPRGGTNEFDLYALGAFELMPASAVPKPASWVSMLAGLVWLVRRRRGLP